jgi:uncharacterized membrane protein
MLPRPKVAKIARGFACVSLVVFGVSIFMENAPFLLTLGAWFALWFFGFHWIAASYTKLTAAQSRAIDYVYLGVATGGVFIFAMSYEVDRYEYRQNRSVAESELALKDTKRHRDAAVVQHQEALCQMSVVTTLPEYCRQAKQLVLDYQAEDRSKDTTDGSRVIDNYLANVHTEKDAEEPKRQLYRLIDFELLKLRTAHMSVMVDRGFIDFNKPMPRDTETHPAWQIFTWPFILAFALALRLTRTTIEVFEWTSRPSPASQTH